LTKIDISSTALEKAIDTAKDFVDKLIGPAVDEAGLLLRDSVALWRFKNQVRVLNKARLYCETHGIEPTKISPKLLWPLLEGASLEDDPVLEDKWATLLGNLVDSEQNIQNHVFPYILGQISSGEFLFLEKVCQDKRQRIVQTRAAIIAHKEEWPVRQKQLETEVARVDAKIAELRSAGKAYSEEGWGLQKLRSDLNSQLSSGRLQIFYLEARVNEPEVFPEGSLADFELSNIVRLGLGRATFETSASASPIEIEPSRDQYVTADVEIEIENEKAYVLTDLGDLFIRACTEKGVPAADKKE
jgi:hypothetical protein